MPYSHVVFTLPGQLTSLAFQNARLLYNLLFQAASEALLTDHRCRSEAHGSQSWIPCCPPHLESES